MKPSTQSFGQYLRATPYNSSVPRMSFGQYSVQQLSTAPRIAAMCERSTAPRKFKPPSGEP
eukprot:1179557-Rhodomonas_salina.1